MIYKETFFFYCNNRFPLTSSSALSRGSRMSVKLWRDKVSHREIPQQNIVTDGGASWIATFIDYSPISPVFFSILPPF